MKIKRKAFAIFLSFLFCLSSISLASVRITDDTVYFNDGSDYMEYNETSGALILGNDLYQLNMSEVADVIGGVLAGDFSVVNLTIINVTSGCIGTLSFRNSSGDVTMVITEDGEVGIGTDSPVQELDVRGDIELGGGGLYYDGTDEFIHINSQAQDWYIGVRNLVTDSGNDFHIGLTQGQDGIFHIQPDGNIGIGTTSPSYKLEVQGAIWASSVYVDDGNVGIGTTNPSAKLDVEVSSSGAATIGSSSNTATGHYAVAIGDNNNASGHRSFVAGFCSKTTGDISIALGSNARALSGYAIAIGVNVEASDTALAMGADTIASAQYATAMGTSTTASGKFATAMGRKITVQGENSFGIGLDNITRTITQPNTMAIMGGNVGINKSNPAYELDVTGDIYCTGKLTSDGGNDPPYVLFNKENLSSIISRLFREVPQDEEHKWDGQAIFYNADIDNMMLINPKTGITREFVWKSDYNLLEERVERLEMLVEQLMK